MSKIRLAEIEASTAKFHEICGLIKHVFTILGLLFAIYLILEGIKPFFEYNPEAINAMSNFVDKLNISNISGYVLSAGLGVAYKLERNGKKRAVKEMAKLQKQLEGSDAYRSSSGLTDEGNTPKT